MCQPDDGFGKFRLHKVHSYSRTLYFYLSPRMLSGHKRSRLFPFNFLLLYHYLIFYCAVYCCAFMSEYKIRTISNQSSLQISILMRLLPIYFLFFNSNRIISINPRNSRARNVGSKALLCNHYEAELTILFHCVAVTPNNLVRSPFVLICNSQRIANANVKPEEGIK